MLRLAAQPENGFYISTNFCLRFDDHEIKITTLKPK
jgi:hypothetical protein